MVVYVYLEISSFLIIALITFVCSFYVTHVT